MPNAADNSEKAINKCSFDRLSAAVNSTDMDVTILYRLTASQKNKKTLKTENFCLYTPFYVL